MELTSPSYKETRSRWLACETIYCRRIKSWMSL